MSQIQFTILSKPVSVNSAYQQSKFGRRFLSAEGKEFKRAVFYSLAGKRLEFEALKLDSEPLAMNLYFFFPAVYNLDGSIKKIDVSNYIKITEDAICFALGYDDSRHFSVTARKLLDRANPRIVVYLSTI